MLNRIQHDTDPATSPIEDASFYLFDGYHTDDIRGEAPPYEFDTIEEMIGGLYHYCRRKSWTAKRAIEKPLEILEKQAVVFDKQAANK